MYFRPSEENFRSGNKCQIIAKQECKIGNFISKKSEISFFFCSSTFSD